MAAGHLRSLKRLAIVELHFPKVIVSVDILDEAELELLRAEAKTELKIWKTHLIQVLKESPSEERKFLRWKVTEHQIRRGTVRRNAVVRENGELEMLPGT